MPDYKYIYPAEVWKDGDLNEVDEPHYIYPAKVWEGVDPNIDPNKLELDEFKPQIVLARLFIAPFEVDGRELCILLDKIIFPDKMVTFDGTWEERKNFDLTGSHDVDLGKNSLVRDDNGKWWGIRVFDSEFPKTDAVEEKAKKRVHENKINWPQVKAGDILPELNLFGEFFFPKGGVVNNIKREISALKSSIDNYWIQYSLGILELTITDIESGAWECKDCHIKMVEEEDYCSGCGGYKKSVPLRDKKINVTAFHAFTNNNILPEPQKPSISKDSTSVNWDAVLKTAIIFLLLVFLLLIIR